MKQLGNNLGGRPIRLVFTAWLLLCLAACEDFSEVAYNEAAGLNGSFEVIENNLPANWNLYSPQTVPSGQFSIRFDQAIKQEGRQSLVFDVQYCSDQGGHLSPGMFREIEAEGGHTYELSLWVRNQGTHYIIRAGGVSAKQGDMYTVLETGDSNDNWRQIVYRYRVPATSENFRFELNVLSGGSLWVDNIRIRRV